MRVCVVRRVGGARECVCVCRKCGSCGARLTVCRYEEEHGIEARWAPESPEYNDALLLYTQRKYRRAVDKLERLVVQRLFEMTKLGMNGVGTA
jgi:hypothetical protein